VVPKRVKLDRPEGVIAGVGLSRTLTPVLPPNFLSRKSILSGIAIDHAGLTLVSAPAGFGKSSLVAEFVSSLEYPAIWYTASDSDGTRELNSHLLQAIRNVQPDFATWFDGSEEIASHDFLARILGELALIDQHFILVIDNNRMEIPGDEDTTNRFLDLIPPNIHAIAIRRSTPATNFSRITSLPNFKMIGINELKFTNDEVEQIARMHGISKLDKDRYAILESTRGWPAAVSLIATCISLGNKGGSKIDLSNFAPEPLNLIVAELLRSLDPIDRNILELLAIFEEFAIDDAEFLLKDKFSLTKINTLATEGIFLINTADPRFKFAINPLIRTALQQQSKISSDEAKLMHSQLSDYFQRKSENLKSLTHAKEAGDSDKYRANFRNGMRNLIATGRGKELIQMSNVIGDETLTGTLKRQTVQLMGYTADFQYRAAQSLIDEMRFSARGTAMEPFITKFISAVSIYIDFAAGRTEELESDYEKVRKDNDLQLDLGVPDKISILRVMAAKASIYDNATELINLQREAKEIAGEDNSNLVLYMLNAIDASSLLSQGEYKDAILLANNVIEQAARYGYSGIFGPLDAMYVRARCLLEFARAEESQELFEQMRELGSNWSQHIWVYVAESFLARHLALYGKTAAALELVRSGRDRAATLPLRNGLVLFCDLTELFVKFCMKDWDRVGVLLGRLPKFLLVERIRAIYNFETGKKSEPFVVAKLPDQTVKDQIYKLLAEAHENIDKEKVALEAMRRALELGSRVGAKETFLRQNVELLNLIIKIATDKPTVYLEEMATLITSRLKERSENIVGLTAALTKRELEILRHLATGVPISAIASTLHVSQNTMKTHLKNVYRKIGASGRDEAVAKAKSLYIL
jgi:LuxR family transcriptional regulator, maltose regulon positive regulatory protein